MRAEAIGGGLRTKFSAMDAAEPNPPSLPPPSKPAWPIIVAVLLVLLPGALGLTGSGEAGMVGFFVVGPIASIIAGILLGIRIGKTQGNKVLLSCLFIVLCLAAAEGLSIAGCSAGNVQLNVH